MAKKPTTNKRKNGKKSDKIQLDDRIRQVQDFMLEGLFTKDIVKKGMELWNVSDRTVYTYVKIALKEFKEFRSEDKESSLARHIANRWYLYKSLLNGNKDKKTGFLKNPKVVAELRAIGQDIAKLEGHYVEKIDHTSGGEKVQLYLPVNSREVKGGS